MILVGTNWLLRLREPLAADEYPLAVETLQRYAVWVGVGATSAILACMAGAEIAVLARRRELGMA